MRFILLYLLLVTSSFAEVNRRTPFRRFPSSSGIAAQSFVTNVASCLSINVKNDGTVTLVFYVPSPTGLVTGILQHIEDIKCPWQDTCSFELNPPQLVTIDFQGEGKQQGYFRLRIKE